jgi:ferredoxin
MALKIAIDRELCMSAGSCVDLADNTFELDNEGIAVVIITAAQSCPVDAITIVAASE